MRNGIWNGICPKCSEPLLLSLVSRKVEYRCSACIWKCDAFKNMPERIMGANLLTWAREAVLDGEPYPQIRSIMDQWMTSFQISNMRIAAYYFSSDQISEGMEWVMSHNRMIKDVGRMRMMFVLLEEGFSNVPVFPELN